MHPKPHLRAASRHAEDDETSSRPLGPADADLLTAIADGSEPAFQELRRRYRRSVEGTCARISGTGCCEDCAQEVFVRIWQKARLYDSTRGSVAVWVSTLANNVARNHRRGQPRDVPHAPADERAADEAGGERLDIERFWISAALERLPHHERRVIELAYRHDMSQAQIARALNTPLGTVKTWTRQGLHRLATLLEEEEPA